MDYKTDILDTGEKLYEVWIGKNAKSNETIIRLSDQHDLWFHLDGISSPHIILRTNGDTIHKRFINQVALKLFDYKTNVPRKTKVIYTTVNNIKLTKTIGTVITSNIKTIRF